MARRDGEWEDLGQTNDLGNWVPMNAGTTHGAYDPDGNYREVHLHPGEEFGDAIARGDVSDLEEDDDD
jgi:hypothetical protein